MKRSVQEVIELIVFGLIALVLVMLLLWGVGYVFTFIGYLLKLLGGFFWSILKFVLPVAIVALLVYFLVRLVMKQSSKPAKVEVAGAEAGTSTTSPTTGAPIDASTAEPVTDAKPATPTTPTASTPAQAATFSEADTDKGVEATKDAASETSAAETDDAERIDTSVDTSGFKEMDDEAEELEDEDDAKS